MADPTQIDPPDSTLSAPSAFGWCHWHHGHTRGIRLIDVIEQGSGSGGHGWTLSMLLRERPE